MVTATTPDLATSLLHLESHNNIVEQILSEIKKEGIDAQIIERIKWLAGNVICTRNILENVLSLPKVNEVLELFNSRHPLAHQETKLSTEELSKCWEDHSHAFITEVEKASLDKLDNYATNTPMGVVQIKELVNRIVSQEAYTIGLLGQFYKDIKKASPE